MLKEATRKVVALRGQPRSRIVVDQAREVLRQQSDAIADLADRLDDSFAQATEILYQTTGHVVVTGVGKSGHVGRKLAATLASTGTPSFFVHAAEAYHGDLGMITERDVVILISCSGETEEVVRLLPHLERLNVPMIGLVGRVESTLTRGVDVALDVSVDRESCPNNLAPTSSTMATMAMGDALACSLISRRGFGASDFAKFHPGGSLGHQLTTRVIDAMRSTDLPVVSPKATVGESLVVMTQGRLGLVLVMAGRRLVGLITDGDLRRAMQRYNDGLLAMSVTEIMTENPVTIHEDMLLTHAHQRMQHMKLKVLVVVNAKGKVAGVVEVFDEK